MSAGLPTNQPFYTKVPSVCVKLVLKNQNVRMSSFARRRHYARYFPLPKKINGEVIYSRNIQSQREVQVKGVILE